MRIARHSKVVSGWKHLKNNDLTLFFGGEGELCDGTARNVAAVPSDFVTALSQWEDRRPGGKGGFSGRHPAASEKP
jgi:hypothetical protein